MNADGTSTPPSVMVVTSNFPPDASVGTLRTLRLVRHLTDAGWNVDVVTAEPEGFRPATVIDPALLEKVPSAVGVIRAKAWRPAERLAAAVRPTPRRAESRQSGGTQSASQATAKSGPGRWFSRAKQAAGAALALPDREVSWLVPAVAKAWREALRRRRPDVIYSSGPPFTAHLVGFALSRLADAPWVADFRDPWARAPWREDRFGFERGAWEILERFVVTRANAAIFVTETNRRDFAVHYGSSIAARFHVVTNGCDVADFTGLGQRPAAPDGIFVLLHAGSLYGARTPAPLFRALAAGIAAGAIDKNRFCLRFIGRIGVQGVDLPALARDLGLERIVEFVGHMPRRQVLQEMLDASALLVVQPETTVSIPAKLYEYLAAGKPILALAEPGGETAELVRHSRAGTAVPAADERAIEHALVSMTRQVEPFIPVDPTTYDGNVRAAEIRGILCGVFRHRGEVVPVGGEHVEVHAVAPKTEAPRP